jgi:hypothetical protein
MEVSGVAAAAYVLKQGDAQLRAAHSRSMCGNSHTKTNTIALQPTASMHESCVV